VSFCNIVLISSVTSHKATVHAAADFEPRAMKKERRANRNVTTTTLSADPLAGEDPSARGRAGSSQSIR